MRWSLPLPPPSSAARVTRRGPTGSQPFSYARGWKRDKRPVQSPHHNWLGPRHLPRRGPLSCAHSPGPMRYAPPTADSGPRDIVTLVTLRGGGLTSFFPPPRYSGLHCY